jgi:hypothetical protein
VAHDVPRIIDVPFQRAALAALLLFIALARQAAGQTQIADQESPSEQARQPTPSQGIILCTSEPG